MSTKTIPLNVAHAVMNDVERFKMPRGLALAYHTFRLTGQKDRPDKSANKPEALPGPTAENKPNIPTVQARPRARVVQATVIQRNKARLETMSRPQVVRSLANLARRYSYQSIARYIIDSNGTHYSPVAVRNWVLGHTKPDDASLRSIRAFLIAHRDFRSKLELLTPAGPRN